MSQALSGVQLAPPPPGEGSTRLTPSLAAVARQPLLGVACAVSIDQYTCITEKRYAVLTPNSSIPSTASSAPIICQGRCSVSPDAPRVLIESSEKNKASVNEPRAPSHKYAVTS